MDFLACAATARCSAAESAELPAASAFRSIAPLRLVFEQMRQTAWKGTSILSATRSAAASAGGKTAQASTPAGAAPQQQHGVCSMVEMNSRTSAGRFAPLARWWQVYNCPAAHAAPSIAFGLLFNASPDSAHAWQSRHEAPPDSEHEPEQTPARSRSSSSEHGRAVVRISSPPEKAPRTTAGRSATLPPSPVALAPLPPCQEPPEVFLW